VRELSKVRIAPTIAVKQSILHEAYKVLSLRLSSDFISDKSRGTFSFAEELFGVLNKFVVAIEHTAALFYSWSMHYIVNGAPVTLLCSRSMFV